MYIENLYIFWYNIITLKVHPNEYSVNGYKGGISYVQYISSV